MEDTGIPPPQDREALHDSLSGSVCFVPVTGAPHPVNLTHPLAVNPRLLKFLRTHG